MEIQREEVHTHFLCKVSSILKISQVSRDDRFAAFCKTGTGGGGGGRRTQSHLTLPVSSRTLSFPAAPPRPVRRQTHKTWLPQPKIEGEFTTFSRPGSSLFFRFFDAAIRESCKHVTTENGRGTRFVASVLMRRVGTRALPHDRRHPTSDSHRSVATGRAPPALSSASLRLCVR